MMVLERTAIAGVLIIRPTRYEDARGFFAPVYKQSVLEAAGVAHDWVQDNQSLSRRRGTVRGLHFQRPPFAQAKLALLPKGRENSRFLRSAMNRRASK